MTLYSPDGIEITDVPHQAEFDLYKDRLTEEQIVAIQYALSQFVDGEMAAGKTFVTSSWVPNAITHDDGHEWAETPFYPIWDLACGHSWEQSGWCFGLFLWEHMMGREEDWMFYQKDDIRGKTYHLWQH
jgi:hypothetical protein